MQSIASGRRLSARPQRTAWKPLDAVTGRRMTVWLRIAWQGRHAPTVVSALKEGRKTTGGRKGEGKTTSGRKSPSQTTSGRKEAPKHSSSSPRAPQRPAPQPQAQQQKQQRAADRERRGAAGGQKQQPSRMDQYMRKHPFFSRFYDTTLLLGDAVMILATEASSGRIEWSSFPTLVGVLLLSWLAAGALNGDYSPSGSRAHEDVPWQLSMLGPTFGAVLGAALTWSFASTVSAAAYAGLVAANLLDAAPVVEGLNTDDLSPQLEVIVALLITMVCWRGIVSKIRPMGPGAQ